MACERLRAGRDNGVQYGPALRRQRDPRWRVAVDSTQVAAARAGVGNHVAATDCLRSILPKHPVVAGCGVYQGQERDPFSQGAREYIRNQEQDDRRLDQLNLLR
jgi:hypothetical protein